MDPVAGEDEDEEQDEDEDEGGGEEADEDEERRIETFRPYVQVPQSVVHRRIVLHSVVVFNFVVHARGGSMSRNPKSVV